MLAGVCCEKDAIMRAILLALIVGTLVPACAKEPPPQPIVVKPRDPVPGECSVPPERRKKLAPVDMSAADAARAYDGLSGKYDGVVASYERCQTWAKGQR